jgi:hypothetical protein
MGGVQSESSALPRAQPLRVSRGGPHRGGLAWGVPSVLRFASRGVEFLSPYSQHPCSGEKCHPEANLRG